MNNKTTSDGETSRRDFLKTSSTAAVASAATLSLISRGTAYGQNSDTIRVGLVGCGGRGTGAANQALLADDNVKLTAVADVFPDKVDRAVNGLKKRHEKKVDVPHQFVGLDAYQKLIDSGVDLVVLATPPGFRPLHFRAVVEAGKHCFIEKPMATDAPGVRSIMESVKISKQKNLAIRSGPETQVRSPGRRPALVSVLILNHLQQGLRLTSVIKQDAVDATLSTTRKFVSSNVENFTTRVITE